ncbi:MAG: haloacid dehalogenase-like hydrolase [Polyangiaceae bacterium]|nr:haloacid dehalogenase-like hydrolase [Polyangiaceae bacterium]
MLALSGCEGPAGEPGLRGADGADGTDGTGSTGWSPLLRLLDESLTTWLPENRTALNDMILALGATNPSYNPARRPVVAFDWDNTVLKNDIGDATFFWMVANDKVLQPAGRDWSTTSPNLTLAARNALNGACDAAGNPGEPLLTSLPANYACADEIVSIYNSGKTVAGAQGNAWSPAVTLTMNSAYAWVAQLLAGYKPHEVRDMARAAFDQNNLAALDTKQTVGTNTTLTGYVRVYEEIRDLAETLDQNGFDVWVVTASPQFVVEAISDEIGVPMARVVGIRNVIVGGRLTADLEGCGSVADGDNTMISFYNGKRCWMSLAGGDESGPAQAPGLRGGRLRHRHRHAEGRDLPEARHQPEQDRDHVQRVLERERQVARAADVHLPEGPEVHALPVQHRDRSGRRPHRRRGRQPDGGPARRRVRSAMTQASPRPGPVIDPGRAPRGAARRRRRSARAGGRGARGSRRCCAPPGRSRRTARAEGRARRRRRRGCRACACCCCERRS